MTDILPLLEEARDLLAERIHGSPARSPGHNARLVIEEAIKALAARGGEAVAWRPEVVAFANLMEMKLRANDHKGGWAREHPTHLLDRLKEETGELRFALEHGRHFERGATPEWSERVGFEAADVANFAMMIADVCGSLQTLPGVAE